MSAFSLFMASAASNIADGADRACGVGAGSACNKVGVAHIFANVANALTILVGAISVIFIIIGGLRYVISNGDSKQVTAAKDTILYAVIGVVVAIVAFGIVQFIASTIGR